MTTILKLGPSDRGRKLSLEEYLSGHYQEGFKYELIDGRLAVSPQPDLPENQVEVWLLEKLLAYKAACPDVINYVTTKGRVFVPNREDVTAPEPDIAAFRNFPRDRPTHLVNWDNISPILVAEILSTDPDKDLTRNPELYLGVRSIREYWVLDIRQSTEQPTLTAHRRRGNNWDIGTVPGGQTYTTNLLPGFNLILDIRQ